MDVSSGKSAGAIAKDRGWPRNSVRQRDAAVDRGDPSPRFVGGIERRLTPELLDEIRKFFEEDSGWISVKVVSKATKPNHIVSYLQSKSHPLSTLASTGHPRCAICRTVTSVIVASVLKRCWRSWRLDLEGAFRGRSRRVDGWIWTSFVPISQK